MKRTTLPKASNITKSITLKSVESFQLCTLLSMYQSCCVKEGATGTGSSNHSAVFSQNCHVNSKQWN